MSLARHFILLSALAVVAACTPADQEYCNARGVQGAPEYAVCLDYYHTQERSFRADREQCDLRADETYPRSLYDRGHYQPVFWGGGGFARGGFGGPWGGPGFARGGFGGWDQVYISPDMAHNTQVDALRNRIVGPCMSAKGWNSSITWQQGRHRITRKPPITSKPRGNVRGGTTERLPWLH